GVPDYGRLPPGRRVFPRSVPFCRAEYRSAPGALKEDVYGFQEHLPGPCQLCEDQYLDPDPQPHRNPEELLRAIPADARPAQRARGRGAAVGLQERLPDNGPTGELLSGV